MAGANYMGGSRNNAKARSKDVYGRTQKGHFKTQQLTRALHNSVKTAISVDPISLRHARGSQNKEAIDLQAPRGTHAFRQTKPGLPKPPITPNRLRRSRVLEALDFNEPTALLRTIDQILATPDLAGLSQLYGRQPKLKNVVEDVRLPRRHSIIYPDSLPPSSEEYSNSSPLWISSRQASLEPVKGEKTIAQSQGSSSSLRIEVFSQDLPEPISSSDESRNSRPGGPQDLLLANHSELVSPFNLDPGYSLARPRSMLTDLNDPEPSFTLIPDPWRDIGVILGLGAGPQTTGGIKTNSTHSELHQPSSPHPNTDSPFGWGSSPVLKHPHDSQHDSSDGTTRISGLNPSSNHSLESGILAWSIPTVANSVEWDPRRQEESFNTQERNKSHHGCNSWLVSSEDESGASLGDRRCAVTFDDMLSFAPTTRPTMDGARMEPVELSSYAEQDTPLVNSQIPILSPTAPQHLDAPVPLTGAISPNIQTPSIDKDSSTQKPQLDQINPLANFNLSKHQHSSSRISSWTPEPSGTEDHGVDHRELEMAEIEVLPAAYHSAVVNSGLTSLSGPNLFGGDDEDE